MWLSQDQVVTQEKGHFETPKGRGTKVPIPIFSGSLHNAHAVWKRKQILNGDMTKLGGEG